MASRGVCEGLQVFRTRNENWALAEARSQWPADEAQELAESARSSLWTAEVDLSLTPLGSKLLCGFFSAGMLDSLPPSLGPFFASLEKLNGVPPEFGRSYGEKGIFSWALGVAFEQI